jgi:hypothetical protein
LVDNVLSIGNALPKKLVRVEALTANLSPVSVGPFNDPASGGPFFHAEEPSGDFPGNGIRPEEFRVGLRLN